MCFKRQPEPPINKPDYEPEDAYKHFVYSVETPDGKKREVPNATAPGRSAPSVRPNTNTIRM